jgi:cupin superfamily acireductone dioxygenase involved in methionine salvage
MTKDHNVTTSVDSKGRIPSTTLQQYVDAAKANRHFATLSEADQIAYVRLLIEAEEWAQNFGFKRTYLNSFLAKGGSDE